MDCLFCKKEMEPAGYTQFVCLNHKKNQTIQAVKVPEGVVFLRTIEEAYLSRDGLRIKYPLSKLALLDIPTKEVSKSMKKFLNAIRPLKRHAVVAIF